jgi:8-oxo-dGTP pyrophosphatase MutT (NUDIX family)
VADRSRLSRGEESPNPWTRKTRTTVYANPWLDVHHDDVIRPDGTDGIYGVVHFHNRSVGVVALDDHGRVLMIGQFRYAIDRYSWEIPAGGAPAGEDPVDAAKRELKEETGYTAETMKLLVHAHMSNSVTDEEGYCFLAAGLSLGPACPESTERLDSRWLNLDETLRAISRGEITDALTIMGLHSAALERKG